MWNNIERLREVEYGHVYLHLLVAVCHEAVHSYDELGLARMQFPESVLELRQDVVPVQMGPDVTAYYMFEQLAACSLQLVSDTGR